MAHLRPVPAPAAGATLLPFLNPRLTNPIDEPSADWLLWQLADSGFPTGSFAHSSGLEAAVQHGAVRSRRELAEFLEASLHQWRRAVVPWTIAAHQAPERIHLLDQHCDAFTNNHVANRASRAQGRALLTAVQKSFGIAIARFERVASSADPDDVPLLSCGHWAPLFGAAARRLGIPRESMIRLVYFGQLRSILAAAVRLNVLGPMDAQRLQFQSVPLAERLVQSSHDLSLQDLAQVSPLLDIWQATQDRLYSRLFQS